MKVDTQPRLRPRVCWVDFRIVVCHTSTGSSFVHYQCGCLWFPEIIFGSCVYLKVTVSDRVTIEKSVGSQLAVPMSLNIRRNSHTRLLFQEIYYFKIFLAYWQNVKRCFPIPVGTIFQFWRNLFSLRIKFVDGFVGYHNFEGFNIQ